MAQICKGIKNNKIHSSNFFSIYYGKSDKENNDDANRYTSMD